MLRQHAKAEDRAGTHRQCSSHTVSLKSEHRYRAFVMNYKSTGSSTYTGRMPLSSIFAVLKNMFCMWLQQDTRRVSMTNALVFAQKCSGKKSGLQSSITWSLPLPHLSMSGPQCDQPPPALRMKLCDKACRALLQGSPRHAPVLDICAY